VALVQWLAQRVVGWVMKNTSAILLVGRPFGPRGFGLRNRQLTAVLHAT
jgi:hypothetical protein